MITFIEPLVTNLESISMSLFVCSRVLVQSLVSAVFSCGMPLHFGKTCLSLYTVCCGMSLHVVILVCHCTLCAVVCHCILEKLVCHCTLCAVVCHCML